MLPVGAELFCVDRRTDMTKLLVAFLDFVKAPKENLNKMRTKTLRDLKFLRNCGL